MQRHHERVLTQPHRPGLEAHPVAPHVPGGVFLVAEAVTKHVHLRTERELLAEAIGVVPQGAYGV